MRHLDVTAVLLALTAIGLALWEGGNPLALILAGAAIGVATANLHLRLATLSTERRNADGPRG